MGLLNKFLKTFFVGTVVLTGLAIAYADLIEEYRGTLTLGAQDDITAVSINSGVNFINKLIDQSGAGSSISDATDLTGNFVRISSCSAGQGVQLRTLPLGTMAFIANQGGAACNVYPPNASTAFRGGGSAPANGAAIALANSSNLMVVATTATRYAVVEH